MQVLDVQSTRFGVISISSDFMLLQINVRLFSDCQNDSVDDIDNRNQQKEAVQKAQQTFHFFFFTKDRCKDV